MDKKPLFDYFLTCKASNIKKNNPSCHFLSIRPNQDAFYLYRSLKSIIGNKIQYMVISAKYYAIG